MGWHSTPIGRFGGKLRARVHLLRPRSPASVAAALLALATTACASSSNAPAEVDAGTDAPGERGGDGARDLVADRARDVVADAADGDASAPPFSLGLAPPAVDCAPYAAAAACTLHVASGAPSGGDGLTWATAFTDVQDALDRAPCGCAVWIAAGTYLPTRSLDPPGATPDARDRSFVLWPGAQVLGGFVGDEVDATARAPGHETILSADLGVTGTLADNAYHVVIGADGATLDGLTLRDAEAIDGLAGGQGVGAGLFVFGASMTLRNVVVSDNDAESGAGIYADERSRVHIVGCTFARDSSNDGGALVVLGDVATVESSLFEDNVGTFSGPAITTFAGALSVTDSRFLRNRGDSGGAVTVSGGDATFARCWFEGNEAGSFGGAMLVRFDAAAHVSSSVFVANGSVGFGGALAVWTASLEVEAATIVDDTAAFGGAFLVKDGSQFRLADSVVWRSLDDEGHAFDLDGAASTLDVATSDLPAEVAATASFDADPMFGNVPLATRFAEEAGDVGDLPVANADKVFAVGDRVELGVDGVARTVTAVAGDQVSFAPPLTVAVPRFARIDLWAADAPSLTLDLSPRAGSPLIDAASAAAPALDVFGHARDGKPDIGAVER
ncbi:MAG TPA: right-handed parallel beta-helix repeat-containing protein [Polyangia bacterium]|jgi:hypothetical protein|nr:right-handed parallel beta-helix repeat-containing protein [Polyangia bacterium]